MNSEHVEVLRVLRDRWAGPDERVALDAAIASLSAPQPPAEAQRCSCPSGDGSLRWPCSVHPPETKPAPVDGSLRAAVLKWWAEHQYDTDSHPEDGERNVYSEPPEFVRIARQPAAPSTDKCSTCGGAGWVAFDSWSEAHHKKCPDCSPTPSMEADDLGFHEQEVGNG